MPKSQSVFDKKELLGQCLNTILMIRADSSFICMNRLMLKLFTMIGMKVNL